MYKEEKLKNDLKLITVPMDGTKTITILVMFKTGSRYESRENNGISHFLEHMFFKGTEKRPGHLVLSSELDSLGCEYNAFTSKENTGYWIKVDSGKIDQALDIISDMLINSKFEESEIEKEKGVIIEEINMYHDNPKMYIEDLFEQCLYGDQPAGWEIIGPKENIKKFTREDFLSYFNTQYGIGSAVVCLAGKVGEKEKELAEKYFADMKKDGFIDKIRVNEKQSEPNVLVHKKKVDQSVLALGTRAYPIGHPDEYVLKVLSVLLGGSMSSRLFVEIREKRGLAYFVRTMSEFFTDSGYLTTQAGVPNKKVDEAVKIILAEYKKMSEELISEEELKKIKDLIKGRNIIALESSDDMANWYARQATLRGEIKTPEEFFEKIDKVTSKDIKRVAEDIFKNEKLNLAIIGPFENKEKFEKIAKF